MLKAKGFHRMKAKTCFHGKKMSCRFLTSFRFARMWAVSKLLRVLSLEWILLIATHLISTWISSYLEHLILEYLIPSLSTFSRCCDLFPTAVHLTHRCASHPTTVFHFCGASHPTVVHVPIVDHRIPTPLGISSQSAVHLIPPLCTSSLA